MTSASPMAEVNPSGPAWRTSATIHPASSAGSSGSSPGCGPGSGVVGNVEPSRVVHLAGADRTQPVLIPRGSDVAGCHRTIIHSSRTGWQHRPDPPERAHPSPAAAIARLDQIRPNIVAALAADKVVSPTGILTRARRADDPAGYWASRRPFLALVPYFRAFHTATASRLPAGLAEELSDLGREAQKVAAPTAP